jgi:hypothetical protein
MNIERMMLGLCLVLLVVSCSTTQDLPPKSSMDQMLAEVTQQDGRACVRLNDINGYATVSDGVVSVSGRRKETFLVTTLYRCHLLDDGMGIAFSGRFSEVCGGGMDTIATREESCPIKHIYEFRTREDAFAAIHAAEARREVNAQYPLQDK